MMPETTRGPGLGVAASAAHSTPTGAATGGHRAVEPDRAVVLAALAETVLAVPGVVRLEPTLSTSGPGLLLHRNPTDGIRLLIRTGAAQVDINIATQADCQARTVAHQIQANTTSVLLAHGYPSSSVTVSVLTVEPAAVL